MGVRKKKCEVELADLISLQEGKDTDKPQQNFISKPDILSRQQNRPQNSSHFLLPLNDKNHLERLAESDRGQEL